ncbi:unnamed protein product, partial [Mesorhabditis belari]|uniref:Fatty acyl-CoA reductase n=1 Tax=Mesorhabditis belari TaxID=2138241 RepID=A0AAF3EBP9_9BILA
MSSHRRIEDVLADRSVFVTGFTGFLGKVLVEKLIYSVPKIKKVYCLIRPQKGHSPNDRLQKILESTLFNRIRSVNPGILSKIHAVAGDLTEDGLGLNQHDHQEICDNVHVVFHCAATVRFDEPLQDAVQMNLMGTARIVALCHSIHNLLCLMHTSTAYANCDLKMTDEKIYDSPVAPSKLLEAVDWMDEEIIDMITPKLLGNRPNTYTLTKALAESFLKEEGHRIPTIIVRPSIIGSCWREPIPGWTDNYNGATGVFAAVATGALTNMRGSSASRADIVPVDIVSNMCIAAAAHRMQTQYSEIPVMHCASGDLNPVYWSFIVSLVDRFYVEYPITNMMRVPAGTFHQSHLMWWINWKFYHHLPSQIADWTNGIMGKRKRYMRLYGKVERMIEALHYFTTNEWIFRSTALPKLYDELTTEDKHTFNFDIRQVDWHSYMFDYFMGTRRHVLKEELETIPEGLKLAQKLRYKRFLLQAVLCFVGLRLFGWNKTTKRQRWTSWALAVLTAHWYTNRHSGPPVKMKTLEEYKKNAMQTFYC